MLDQEKFEKLKSAMVKHLNREMHLIKRLNRLKPEMSHEQLQEIIVALATHPHTLQSEKFLTVDELKKVLEQIKEYQEKAEKK